MKIKIIIIGLSALLGSIFSVSAQPNPFVNPYPHHQNCVPPTAIEEALLTDIIQQKSIDQNQRIGQNSYTIPVVFHIIHKDSLENISDAQIYNAMDGLNADFNSSNADLAQIPAPFTGIIGNATINFVLAKQAPDGLCTTGINRYLSGYDSYYGYYWTDDGQYYLNDIKKAHYWDTDKYLNIYVVNESYNSGLSFFPYQVEAKANANKWLDGVMIRHYNLGNIGTAKHNNLPHVFTHETGHYLDLLHTWGNWFYPGSSQLSWENDCNNENRLCPNFYCLSDDLVDDTPNTEYDLEGCKFKTTTCGSADNATNVMGYGCEIMFTQGQVKRMHRALNSNLADRTNLWSQKNLDYTLKCSGEKATISCKKLYSSFVYKFSIVTNNTGYIHHYLNKIPNKIRYRINGGDWVVFPVSTLHYHTVTDIVACATYEFQISEQCDTLFSPWSTSKFFFTNDTLLSVADANSPAHNLNCFENDTIQDCSQLQLSYQLTHQTYAAVNNGAAQVFVYGGHPPYQTEWSTGQQNQQIDNLSPGLYSVTITDSLNCTISNNFEIFEVLCSNLQLTLNATHETYFEANDGTAYAQISGGLAPYNYQWFHKDSVAALYNLSPGVYRVFIKDSKGCTAEDSIKVEAIDCSLFSLEAAISHQSYYAINDGAAAIEAINGTAPFSYNWSNGDSVANIINVPPDNYTITVTDALACKATLNVPIDSVNCLNFSLDIFKEDTNNDQANNGSASATLSGGNPPYQYLWTTNSTLPTVNNLSIGSYGITATDDLGCQQSAQVVINRIVCDTIQLAFTTTNETYFETNDGTAAVTATGANAPYTYQWSTGETTPSINNLTPAEYWVQVSDSLNCSVIDSFTIQAVNCNNLSIKIKASNPTYVAANDGTVQIEASGGNLPYQHKWSTGDTAAYQSNLMPAIYYVTLTDNLGCFLKDSVTIQPINCSTLQVTTNVKHQTERNKNDGSITLHTFGGEMPYTYQWSNGETTPQISNLMPGDYNFQIIDQVGCTLTDKLQVKSIECSALWVDVIKKEVTCVDGNDGALFIAAVENAQKPYVIHWSNGPTAELNNDLVAGLYTLFLTDTVGCRFEQSYTIKAGATILTTTQINPASNAQTPDASINLSVTGGHPPYQYYWANGATEADIYNIFAGTYWLSITDSLNCHAFITNIDVGIAENCPYEIIETQNASVRTNMVKAAHSIQSNRKIQQGESLQYKAGSSINLEIDFHILKGATFEAMIEPCSN